jgi:hypothetical protein
VAFVVEDAAILSRELEQTTSTRVREVAINHAKQQAANAKHGALGEINLHERGPPKAPGKGSSSSSSSDSLHPEVVAMVGHAVARHMGKHRIGAKMAGAGVDRWGTDDKEFALFSGLEMADMG